MTNDQPPTPSFNDVPRIPEEPSEEDSFPEPTHPDYQLILGLIEAGFDEVNINTEDGARPDINAWVVKYVDPQSIATVGLQRAVGMFQVESPEAAQRVMELATKIAMLYTEAFIAGVKYGWMVPPTGGPDGD